MRYPSARCLVGVLVALLAPVGTVEAQGLVRLTSGGQLGAEFRGIWHGGDRDAGSSGFYEWVQIPIQGALADRRLLSYRLTLRPAFRQQQTTGFDESLDGRELGLTFSARAFTALPIKLGFTATRSAGSSAGGFGTTSEFRNTLAQVDVDYRNRFFPMRFAYARRRSANAFTNAPDATPIERDFRQREFRFTATSSKTSVAIGRVLYREEVLGTAFDTWNARVNHTLRWGRWGRRSRLETTYERTDQTGSFPTARRRWRERLRLQHRPWLNTQYEYRQTSTRLAATSSMVRSLSASATARVHRYASTSLHGATYWAEVSGGTERVTTVRPRMGLNIPIPAGWRVTLNAAVGLERRSRAGEDLTAAVVDEPHVVDPSRSFVLDLPEVDPASVTVRRADGSFVFEEGIDYTLVPVDRLLRIDVPPDSRILGGETVLVSYRYRLPAGVTGSVVTGDVTASLSGSGVSLHHQRRIRDRNGSIDAVRGLASADEMQTRLTVRRPLWRGDVTFNASAQRRTSAGQTSNEYTAGMGYGFPLSSRLHTSTNLDWSRSASGPTELNTLAASAAAVWRAARTLRLDLRIDGFMWTPEDNRSQRFLAVRLGAVWRIGSIETQLRYEHHRRDFSSTRLTNRLTMRAVRRF